MVYALPPLPSTFLGPRGPLGLPSFARSPVRKKNLDQLYSSIIHHRTTANLSDIVWCMSGGVWWCLVVSDACLVVSGDVNVYRLIWPELIDVYGQISLPVHVTDAAKMLMQCCCWCTVAADVLMRGCCWCTVAADVLLLRMHWCTDAADAADAVQITSLLGLGSCLYKLSFNQYLEDLLSDIFPTHESGPITWINKQSDLWTWGAGSWHKPYPPMRSFSKHSPRVLMPVGHLSCSLNVRCMHALCRFRCQVNQRCWCFVWKHKFLCSAQLRSKNCHFWKRWPWPTIFWCR